MNYNKLLEQLSDFKYIFVTGPHRAGTTFSSYIIALDLDYSWFESQTWMSQYDTMRDCIQSLGGPLVLHCPAFCHTVHEYRDVPDVAVVIVRRSVEDILASQRRVGWGFEDHEMTKYPGYDKPIATAKYHYWDTVQKLILRTQAFELEYNSLKNHLLWVNKEYRQNFHIAQIKRGEPRGDRIQNPRLVD